MKYSYILFFIFFILSSCEEKITIQTDKDFKPAFVINSFLGANSDTVKVYITKTVPAYTNVVDKIEVGSVSLLNLFSNELIDLEKVNNIWKIKINKPESGEIYKLIVKDKNLNVISEIKDTIPSEFKIKNINYVFSEKQQGVDIQLFCNIDNGITGGYFEILIFLKHSYNEESGFHQYSLFTSDNQITSEDYYPKLINFTSENPKTLLFKMNANENSFSFAYSSPIVTNTIWLKTIPHTIRIELRRVSYAYYKYKTSLYKQQLDINGDILFGLPALANVYSNVANGYGIFGCYNSTDTIIDIEEYVVDK